MNDFLPKPVLKPDLENILKKYIVDESAKGRGFNVLLDKICK